MFDNVLVLLILGAIIGIALYEVVRYFVRTSQITESKTDNALRLMNVIRIAALDAFDEAMEAKVANEGGFDAIKEYVLNHVMSFIGDSDFTSQDERKELNRSTVSLYLTPILYAIWNYKIEMPQKNLTKATLEEARAALKE